MHLRNATLFRISSSVATDARRLEDAASDRALRPCGQLEMSTIGFVPPVAGNDTLIHRRGNNFLEFAVGREDKILPPAVVIEAVNQRINEIAEKEGRSVGARERKRIKDDVVSQLLPVAFIKKTIIRGYLDLTNGWVVIDTASRKTAENIVTLIRLVLASFPAIPLALGESPRVLLTEWLSNGYGPSPLALGDECELRDYAGADGARWKGRNADLNSDGVKEHLRDGKQCARLGLVYQNRFSFVLKDDLTVSKFKLHDIDDRDDLSSAEDEEALALATFTLYSNEFGLLLETLQSLFAIPRPAETAPA